MCPPPPFTKSEWAGPDLLKVLNVPIQHAINKFMLKKNKSFHTLYTASHSPVWWIKSMYYRKVKSFYINFWGFHYWVFCNYFMHRCSCWASCCSIHPWQLSRELEWWWKLSLRWVSVITSKYNENVARAYCFHAQDLYLYIFFVTQSNTMYCDASS